MSYARRWPPAKARNAVDLHHLPEGTHCLANRPGPLVRLTFLRACFNNRPVRGPGLQGFRILAVSRRPRALTRRPPTILKLALNGARGRTCTRTREGLSFVPLRWATRAAGAGHKWCPRPDLHRHFARFKGAVSALDYVGCWRRATKWCRVKELHPQPSRSERDASASWANAA